MRQFHAAAAIRPRNPRRAVEHFNCALRVSQLRAFLRAGHPIGAERFEVNGPVAEAGYSELGDRLEPAEQEFVGAYLIASAPFCGGDGERCGYLDIIHTT